MRILLVAMAAFVAVSIQAQVSSFSSVKTFTTPTNTIGESYGSCVDMWENCVIVGAPETTVSINGVNCQDCGAAYIIENDPVTNTPVKETTLTVPGLTETELFGSYVSIYGNWAVVGAPGKIVSTKGKKTSGKGVVYVFNKTTNGDWQYSQTVNATDICSDCSFGTAVSLTENWLAVGACSEAMASSNTKNNGCAYIFELDQTTGTFTNPQKITAPVTSIGDQFGYCIDVCDNVCVVGAPMADVSTPSNSTVNNAGCVYVYTVSPNGTWTCTETITAENCNTNDRFGETVCVTPTSVVVGCENYCYDATGKNYIQNAGAAFVFECNETCTEWAQSCVITPSVRKANDNFGCSVAMCDNYMVVGANYTCEYTTTSTTTNTWNPSAYVFTCDPTTTTSVWSEVCNVEPTGTVGKTKVSPVVAISSNKQIVIAEPFSCMVDNPTTTCGVVELFEACYTTAQVKMVGSTLQCMNNCSSYQWMEYTTKGYMPITGATSPYFTPTKDGVYCVKVSENDYCSSISSCVTVDVDSPVRTMGSLSPAEMKEWAVKVIDLNGQTLMYEQITTTDDTSIDINTLEEGTYLLRVVNKTNTDTPAPVKAVKVKN